VYVPWEYTSNFEIREKFNKEAKERRQEWHWHCQVQLVQLQPRSNIKIGWCIWHQCQYLLTDIEIWCHTYCRTTTCGWRLHSHIKVLLLDSTTIIGLQYKSTYSSTQGTYSKDVDTFLVCLPTGDFWAVKKVSRSAHNFRTHLKEKKQRNKETN
jgi:hypothetical protein